jgi:hypothetical protein
MTALSQPMLQTAPETTLCAAGLERLPLRLTLCPNGRHGLFDAYLGADLICTSHQPLLDGARALLALGYSADRTMTTRHEGKGYDSVIPQPIGEFAKLTVVEEAAGLRIRRWRTRPLDACAARPVASPMRNSVSDVSTPHPRPRPRCTRTPAHDRHVPAF